MNVVLDQVATGVEKAVAEIRAFTQANPDFEPAANVLVSIFENGLVQLNTDIS